MNDVPPDIVVTLPPPPSANRLWRHIPGRRKPIIAPDYARWINEAGWEAKRQLVGVPQIMGWFTAHIEVPSTSRKDLANNEKAILDLMQRIGAIRDDKGCRDIQLVFAERADVRLALWDIGGPVFKRQRGVRPVGWVQTRRPTARQVARVTKALGGMR